MGAQATEGRAVSVQEGFLFAFGVLAAFGAIAVVVSRNVIHAALWLVVALGGVGVIFLLLGAEFVGWVQFLVYVGAIVVLLLFGLMLTRAPIGRDQTDNTQRVVAFLTAGLTFGVLTWLIWRAFGDEQRCVAEFGRSCEIALDKVTQTADVGGALFSGFILPFEVVSVLLLAALVGAIVLARRD